MRSGERVRYTKCRKPVIRQSKELARDWERRQRQRRWVPVASAAAVLIVAAATWVSMNHSGYEQFAVQTHRSYERGTFPLDIASSQPQVVSAWLAPRRAVSLDPAELSRRRAQTVCAGRCAAHAISRRERGLSGV